MSVNTWKITIEYISHNHTRIENCHRLWLRRSTETQKHKPQFNGKFVAKSKKNHHFTGGAISGNLNTDIRAYENCLCLISFLKNSLRPLPKVFLQNMLFDCHFYYLFDFTYFAFAFFRNLYEFSLLCWYAFGISRFQTINRKVAKKWYHVFDVRNIKSVIIMCERV